jgi:hypothetical protein
MTLSTPTGAIRTRGGQLAHDATEFVQDVSTELPGATGREGCSFAQPLPPEHFSSGTAFRTRRSHGRC